MIRTNRIIGKIFNNQNIGHQLTNLEISILQAHLMKMYREIEIVCKRHNLSVCLAYGNVIGALRHNGWIPWDDDLDLHMPRKDYDLFLSKFSKELPSQYKVSSYLSEKGSVARFAKIIDTSTVFVQIIGGEKEHSGVFIDIFPIDNIGRNKFINSIKKYWAYFLMYTATSVMQVENKSIYYKQIMFTTKEGKNNWLFRQLWGRIFSFASSKSWHRWIEKFWIIDRNTGYVHVKPSILMCGKMVKEDIFFPLKKIRTSIGEVYVPNKPEKYLDIIYGDWKTIPKDENRGHHYIKEFNIPNE